MTVEELIGKVHKRLRDRDFSSVGKLAIQVDLSGRIPGVFYIEILDGVVSVMPYEYDDRDALLSVSMTNFDKMLTGKLNPQVAFATGKLKIEGNVDKVLLLGALLQQK